MNIRLAGVAVAVMLLATPAMARDRTGYQAIAAGDLAGAERTIVAERRIFPQRPELMLNLAVVYERTGRVAEARAMYRSVLASAPVAMEMPSGASVSSHLVATAGLAKIGGDTLATR